MSQEFLSGLSEEFTGNRVVISLRLSVNVPVALNCGRAAEMVSHTAAFEANLLTLQQAPIFV
jgi:hypothetical protein